MNQARLWLLYSRQPSPVETIGATCSTRSARFGYDRGMRYDDAVDLFLTHLRVERALSDNTVQAYGRDLSLFSLRMEFADRPLGDLGEDEIRGYLRHLSEHGAKARTIARTLSTFKSFCRFVVDEGQISRNPCENILGPKLGRALPHTASSDDLITLIALPDPSTLRGLRDRAMLSLTYAAGLRVSELLGLMVSDVDLRAGTVSTVGKGDKRRVIPVGSIALGHLEDYLAAQPSEEKGRLLFPGRGGKEMSRVGFWKLVKRYALAAGLPTEFHPHSLRHAFASHLLSGGADLRSVQLLLGHVSIATTEIYTHVSADHVRLAHATAHPRGQSRLRSRADRSTLLDPGFAADS